MIRLKLNEMLETRGLTAYGLHVKSLVTDKKGKPILDKKGKKKYRLHQSVVSKIKNNKSKALQLDILDVLCGLLECQPADLIVYESTTQIASTTQIVERATTQIAKHTQNALTTQTASDNENEFTITTADAGKILDLEPRTVTEYAKKGLLKGKQIGKQNHWFFRSWDVGEFQMTRGKK